MAAADVVRGVDNQNSGASAATGLFVTLTAPAGVASGDQLVVGIELREPPATLSTWRAPAGWTLRFSPAQSSGSAYVYTATYGTDVTGTSWTWDNGASNTTSTRWAATLVCLDGAQVGGYLTGGAQAVASAASVATPRITTPAASFLVGFVGSRTTGGPSFTWPSGWTEQGDTNTGTATNSASASSGAYDTTPTPAGTYSATVTPSATVGSGYAAILAFATTTAPTGGTLTRAATGTLTLTGSAGLGGSLVLSAEGTLTFSSGGSVAGSLVRTGVGTLGLTGSAAQRGTLARTSTGILVLSGQGSTRQPAPIVPPVITSDPFRASYSIYYTVDATYRGAPVAGGTGMRPTGGTITDTVKPGVRRVLSLELASVPGRYDALSPIGTTLTVTGRVRLADRNVMDVPMGVFDVDTETLDEGGGKITLTAPDKWVRLQRAKFVLPQPSEAGQHITQQITDLIQGALGTGEPVVNLASSKAAVTPLVWQADRAQAIIDLATSIGAWVYFDRNGVATIADIPTIGANADWLADASSSGVLTSLSRSRSRTNTYNVVVVDSTSTDPASTFPSQVMWDSDPSSSTYAGTNPFFAPQTAGPFGLATYHYSSSAIATAADANYAAQAILARTVGLASQVSLEQVPNCRVDAFDVIDVIPPKQRYDIPRVVERHVVDTVTHPLGIGQAQQIAGRSTRTDNYT